MTTVSLGVGRLQTYTSQITTRTWLDLCEGCSPASGPMQEGPFATMFLQK